MWSSFYFYKKNYSYLFAIKKLSGKFFRALLKSIIYTLLFKRERQKKYFNRFLGVLKSILNRPPNYRGWFYLAFFYKIYSNNNRYERY